jgi:hypothetical protein
VVTSDRWRRRAGAFAAAVAAAALAGCSAAPAAQSGFDLDAALAKVPADVSTVRGLDLPLDRSLLTPVEELEVIEARTTLIERCLTAHGIGFVLEAVDPVRDATKLRRHGLVDPGEAAAYGYRDPAVFASRAKTPARQPPPDVVSAITGTRTGKVGGRDVPPGGCAGEADRTITPDAKPGQEPVSFGLSNRGYEITRTTPPVAAAAVKWSHCMAEAGFRYDGPDAAMNDPAFSSGRASAHEIAVATQDVRCKERAEWVKTWVAVERAVEDVLIPQYAGDLARERQHKERQLAVARGING